MINGVILAMFVIVVPIVLDKLLPDRVVDRLLHTLLSDEVWR